MISSYIWIGIEHIWFGIDHLLFILGLVLLVGSRWTSLLSTVTAFTVAHSITLALATLEIYRPPIQAVEAVIALSIVLLAADLARAHLHSQKHTPRISSPWIFAFVCGLLHGFGFAGVLGQVGLPPHAITTALLGFNIGVECGQLVFVALLLGIGALTTKIKWSQGKQWVIYGTGTLGSFWVFKRTFSMLFGEGI